VFAAELAGLSSSGGLVQDADDLLGGEAAGVHESSQLAAD
jgi:hypothetical protein